LLNPLTCQVFHRDQQEIICRLAENKIQDIF
jgi:hypothetical protein